MTGHAIPQRPTTPKGPGMTRCPACRRTSCEGCPALREMPEWRKRGFLGENAAKDLSGEARGR